MKMNMIYIKGYVMRYVFTEDEWLSVRDIRGLL
jgi:hypothetical protein